MMNLAIRLTHPHYLVLRRLSYLLCQTLLISVYPLAGVKMKKCISVIYTDIHSIHGIRQKNVGLCPRNCLFLKNSRQEKKYGTAVFIIIHTSIFINKNKEKKYGTAVFMPSVP